MYHSQRVECNTNIFAINSKSYIIPFKHDLEYAPLTHDSYKIYNIGYVDVNIELLFGTSAKWETVSEQSRISPGQTVIFDNVEKLFTVSGVKIINTSDERAIVYCIKTDCTFPEFVQKEQNVLNTHLKDTYSIGVKYVPYVSKKYNGLYNAFWPSNKLNIWKEILIKLQPLIEENILRPLSITIEEYMRNIEQKFKALLTTLNEGKPIFKLYMEIAEDLSEFEKKLILTGNDVDYNLTNMFLLPLFSNFVLMKSIFYTLGITTSSNIGFSADLISHIENQLKVTTKGATKYISNMFKDRLRYAYSTSPPEDLYNSMMNIRTYIGIHGIEFTRIWHNMLRNPFIGEKIFNDVISYSNFFGRQTANLIREATSRKMYPPLTPLYKGFIYNKLMSIHVYLWINYLLPQSPKIGGMKLEFADYSSYIMGTRTEVLEHVDFKEAYIKKLRVTGNGAIDSCTFYMSDERTLFFGTEENGSVEEIFELRDHRIVSIFLSSDEHSLGGQAANIAVSYRLNCDWE